MPKKYQPVQTLDQAAEPLRKGGRCLCPGLCPLHNGWASGDWDGEGAVITAEVQRLGKDERCGGGRRIIRKD